MTHNPFKHWSQPKKKKKTTTTIVTHAKTHTQKKKKSNHREGRMVFGSEEGREQMEKQREKRTEIMR